MNNDLEFAPVKPINGFPRVAAKLASDVDKTTTIFRRFDRLSARCLLLLEAELSELESQLDKYDEEDRKLASPEVLESHSQWVTLERLAHERDGNGVLVYPERAARLVLVQKIQARLREYHEALAVHQTLLNSKAPAATTVKAMKDWFLGTDNGSQVPQLWGASEKMFDDPHDLVALRVPQDQDRLSEFILNYFGRFFKASCPPTPYTHTLSFKKLPLRDFDKMSAVRKADSTSQQRHSSSSKSAYILESSLQRCATIISSMLCAILLFGSVTSLYFVHNPYALLGMLGGWTVLFAVSVGWLTNARRDQIFAATAAYCAVLVVFVSGTLGGAGQVQTTCLSKELASLPECR